jgi:hypothetical protein
VSVHQRAYWAATGEQAVARIAVLRFDPRMRIALLLAAAGWFASLSTAHAQLWVGIDAPAAQATIGDAPTIRVSTMGAVTRVEATLGTHSVSLTKSSASFTGVLSLAGEARGPKTLTVVAYDASDNSVSATRDVFLDRPPAVTVSSPAVGEVLRSDQVRVTATCSDDDAAGGCTLKYGSVTAPLTLDTSAAVPCAPRDSYKVSVEATDSRGQKTWVSVPVFQECDALLREVTHGPSGDVLDFDGERGLFRSPDLHRAWIQSASAATPQLVFEGSEEVRRGDLHGSQAYFVVAPPDIQPPNPPASVKRWTGTQLETLDASDERLSGDWLALLRNLPPEGPQWPDSFSQLLVLRNVTTQEEVWNTGPVPTPGRVRIAGFAVAPDGVVFWQTHGGSSQTSLFWRRGGATQSLGHSGRVLGPLATDGVHATAGVWTSAYQETYLYSENGKEILCSAQPGDCSLVHIAGGWIGYGTPNRLFRRNPAGQIEEITGYPADAVVESIDASGNMVILAGGRRYLDVLGPTKSVSSAHGRALSRGGKWYLLLGRSVFELGAEGTTPGPDAGAPDAGLDGGGESADASFDASSDGGGTTTDAAADAALPWMDASADAGVPGAQVPDAGRSDASAAPDNDDGGDEGCSLGGRRSSDGLLALLFALVLMRARRRFNARVS